MKKLLSLILAISMLLASFGAAMAEGESAAGVWYLQTVSNGAMTLDAGTAGVDFRLTLSEDGSASGYFSVMGEEEAAEGSWTQDGQSVTIVLDGGAQPATLKDSVLSLMLDSIGATMNLTREAPVQENYIPAEIVTGVTLENFIGIWDCQRAETGGMQMALSDLGMMMMLVITGDEALYTAFANGEEVSAAFDAAVAENKLILSYQGNVAMELFLHADGVASYTNAQGIVYYFMPVPVSETAAE